MSPIHRSVPMIVPSQTKYFVILIYKRINYLRT